jgi:hypothetical protein
MSLNPMIETNNAADRPQIYTSMPAWSVASVTQAQVSWALNSVAARRAAISRIKWRSDSSSIAGPDCRVQDYTSDVVILEGRRRPQGSHFTNQVAIGLEFDCRP